MQPKIIRSAEGQALMGGRQTIKLKSEDTNGKLSVMLSAVPAGTGIPSHIHDCEDEIFEIIEGELEITLDGETRMLQAGDMIFMPKNTSHGFKAVRDTIMWVSFVPGGAEKMFIEMASLPPGPPDMQRVGRICGQYGITFVQQ